MLHLKRRASGGGSGGGGATEQDKEKLGGGMAEAREIQIEKDKAGEAGERRGRWGARLLLMTKRNTR